MPLAMRLLAAMKPGHWKMSRNLTAQIGASCRESSSPLRRAGSVGSPPMTSTPKSRGTSTARALRAFVNARPAITARAPEVAWTWALGRLRKRYRSLVEVPDDRLLHGLRQLGVDVAEGVDSDGLTCYRVTYPNKLKKPKRRAKRACQKPTAREAGK